MKHQRHRGASGLLFDRKDYALLNIVNDVLNRKSVPSMKKLIAPYLHPHGIKEMAASKGLRIAYAVVHLLNSLDEEEAYVRLDALRALRDEVLSAPESHLRMNTARVLVQIMKELVRCPDDDRCKLELAHDFWAAVMGKAGRIRRELKKYHLLEMPEEWNQLAFDDHVHDANSKGRKSATHLIMDAWIKGIRSLTVVYYNYISPTVAAELLEAASIMQVTVRIGIELNARLKNKYARFIWIPKGLSRVEDFRKFLHDPMMQDFLSQGINVSAYQQRYVFEVLHAFNRKNREHLCSQLEIEMPPLDEREFMSFVGGGQVSVLHLGKYIHDKLSPLLLERSRQLKTRFDSSDAEERRRIEALLEFMSLLDVEGIIDMYLHTSQNPEIEDPFVPHDHGDTPELLRLSPREMLDRVYRITGFNRISLNLKDLSIDEVIEILHQCKGMVTHLEIYNLKDYAMRRSTDFEQVIRLQAAINSGNPVSLKKFIRNVISGLEEKNPPDKQERIDQLTTVLMNIPELQAPYRKKPLKSFVGSDSTGRSYRMPGMGFVVMQTLPYRAQKIVRKVGDAAHVNIPISVVSHLRETFIPKTSKNRFVNACYSTLRRHALFRALACRKKTDWKKLAYYPSLDEQSNIYSLGGVQSTPEVCYKLEATQNLDKKNKFSWKYLNSNLKNTLKIILGFIPAFLTFALTKEWWVLAYLGAFIWFAVTGVRNIIQSVLGSGGIKRSPLLTWRDFVNWERVSDSLFFTGFSVPLLDYAVKTLLLDRTLGITVSTDAILLYTVMALANGCYISTHNILRGLPHNVAMGNFFRTALSIPIAILFSGLLELLLTANHVPAPQAELQKWAAIISKFASDCVAGVIEGLVDRQRNIKMRIRDYSEKLVLLFEVYARLEVMFPKEDVQRMLESPKDFIKTISSESPDYESIFLVNALDFLYFWMYKPRSAGVFEKMLRDMSQDERKVFLLSQYVLLRQYEISKLFLDGIVGKNFSKALAFYLDNFRDYLEEIQEMASEYAPAEIFSITDRITRHYDEERGIF